MSRWLDYFKCQFRNHKIKARSLRFSHFQKQFSDSVCTLFGFHLIAVSSLPTINRIKQSWNQKRWIIISYIVRNFRFQARICRTLIRYISDLWKHTSDFLQILFSFAFCFRMKCFWNTVLRPIQVIVVYILYTAFLQERIFCRRFKICNQFCQIGLFPTLYLRKGVKSRTCYDNLRCQKHE